MKDISKSIQKVDHYEKVSGKAKYIDDYNFEGQLYAKTFRSTIAKGKIVKRTYPEFPNGYYIVDYTDIPGNNYVQMIFEDFPVFASESVAYIGEPICLVVGPDKETILSLLTAIEITYEQQAPTFDYSDSAVHYDFVKGAGEKVFEDADEIIKQTYKTGYQEHVYIEPQGVIGTYTEEQISVYGSIQCPYYVKNALINTLACSEEAVRVVQTTTGGAFGGKEEFPSLIAAHVAVAVNKIKKPIKLIYSRVEDMTVTTKRHPSETTIEAAIKDNEILGFRTHVSLDGGAYLGLSNVVLERAMLACTGVYSIDNLSISGDVYRTNTVPTGAFRGFGAPQMLFALEMFMHHLAKALKVNPLELRLKYLAKQNDLTSTSGHFRDQIIMPDMIKKAMELSDYENKLKDYKNTPKGIGMSFTLHGCGFTGSGEQDHIKAVVRLQKDKNDCVTVLIAAVDMGQGLKTSMSKIVASVLDIPISQVILNNPDTNLVPDSGPTVASRTTMIVGGLVSQAANKLKDIWVSGQEQKTESHYKQPDYVKWNEEKLNGDAYPAYSWGVNVVEVEFNPISYETKVTGSWSVYDIGKAIDERLVLGQAQGGLLQGVSYGYLENMTHKEGRIMQQTITDYIIPTAKDSFPMVTELMDNPFMLGPFGAKGVGELTLVGGAPAVALAIENAIESSVYKIPVTPEYIMEVLDYDRD